MSGSRSPGQIVSGWPFRAAVGWVTGTRAPVMDGEADAVLPWASVTKVCTAVAVWVAVEEGTVGWDDPAGPPGSTMRHLLSHASGLAPDGDRVLGPPGRRRIYSNRGIEVAADHVAERSSIPFDQYVAEAVFQPLGMTDTALVGSPAFGVTGTLRDLVRLAAELLHPSLVSQETRDMAAEVAFPGLPGVLPGFGSQSENDWGLGVEIRDHKHPHWTGTANTPATFGHFGQSGSFVWVDRDAGVAAASLADQPFGPWAAEAWPPLSDAILRTARDGS